jgi:hypothetical protein
LFHFLFSVLFQYLLFFSKFRPFLIHFLFFHFIFISSFLSFPLKFILHL